MSAGRLGESQISRATPFQTMAGKLLIGIWATSLISMTTWCRGRSIEKHIAYIRSVRVEV
jgi:hypothetical protein